MSADDASALAGLEFAAKLSGTIDSRGLDIQEHRWEFSQPLGSHASGIFRVAIDQQSLAMEANYPSDRRQAIEDRFGLILKEFKRTFRPELILSSTACVRGTLNIDGDSRSFLGGHVANIHADKLRHLGRPLHLFGLRMFLPPYVAQDAPKSTKRSKKVPDARADWGIAICAESLMEDISKLFLEASGEWPAPRKWDDEAGDQVIEHIGTVSDYLSKQFLSFLTESGE